MNEEKKKKRGSGPLELTIRRVAGRTTGEHTLLGGRFPGLEKRIHVRGETDGKKKKTLSLVDRVYIQGSVKEDAGGEKKKFLAGRKYCGGFWHKGFQDVADRKTRTPEKVPTCGGQP